MAVSKAMFAAFTELGLIESVNVEIKLSPTEQYDLVGLHTISEEKLRALDGDALVKLNRAGFLQGAFLVIASLNAWLPPAVALVSTIVRLPPPFDSVALVLPAPKFLNQS